MTEILQRAFEAVSRLPQDRQDDIARYILQLSEDGRAVVPLSADEAKAIAEAEAEFAAHGPATEAEVNAFWRRRGL